MATGRATKPEATQIVLEEAIHRFGNPVEISDFKFWFVIFLGGLRIKHDFVLGDIFR